MNQERLLKVIIGPHISEKSSNVAETYNQYVFRIATDANKLEVKKAVEHLFDVKVKAVTTINVKGKTKRTMRGMGKRNDWKKAYVTLDAGQEIDFADAE